MTTTDPSAATCDAGQVTVASAAPRLVRDVMLSRPKTLPAHATVGEARELFANPKVVTALLVDGTAFAGVLDRDDLPGSLPAENAVRIHARVDVASITPDRPMSDALAALDADGSSRLVVLDDDGVTLAGLLCLDLQREGFCQG